MFQTRINPGNDQTFVNDHGHAVDLYDDPYLTVRSKMWVLYLGLEK